MRKVIFVAMSLLFLGGLTSIVGASDRSWLITLEEPTGIYRRDHEVVTVKASFLPGEARKGGLIVMAPDGREVAPQVAIEQTHPDGTIKAAEILFPASIIPGERPVYRLIAKPATASTAYPSLVARRIGVGRFEIGNEQFAVIVNLGLENTEPALVAAYHKRAGEQRMLNLIDTSPDVTEPLAYGRKSAGFGTFLASAGLGGGRKRSGAFDQIEIVENGPYRLKVRMTGVKLGDRVETWEFTAHAGSPVLHWRSSLDRAEAGVSYGYFFSSVSATPYEPFDKWFDGEETRFPDGWETDHPPDRAIGPKDYVDLPGGHLVYYQRRENYGAMGFFELDPALGWKGIGARQFYAGASLSDGKRGSEIALSFPRWSGTTTVLEARQEYRKFTQPILSVMRPIESPVTPNRVEAQPNESIKIETRPTNALRSELPDQVHLDLNGPWRCQWAEKSEGEKQGFYRADFDDREWRAVTVPGTAHTQILAPPKFHTREAEWISAKEWWYRRQLTLPPVGDGKRLWLNFEATDYYADIYLNGDLIGRHEGYIDPYSIEVTGRLKADGPNSLAVRVWTPVSYYWRHRPYTVKGSYGAVDQKPDKITPLGITRPVRLLATGPATIDEIAIDTRLNKDGSADVVVDLTFEVKAEIEADLRMTLAPHNFQADAGIELTAPLRLNDGLNRRQYVLHVEKPELWWTWDHGKPNLYRLNVALNAGGTISDARSLKIGIREIEHIDWKFYLNGKRFFIRGTNSYYNLFLSEMKRSDYERDLDLMRKMNINMIRLHCHFTNPEFYDLSDELGILIFQDYLEAWYPEDRAFSLKAAALYDPLIRYVRNHPSIAVWATSDEESLENYRDLTKHLEPRLFVHDPQRRPVVRSTGRYGDAHVYEGWYGGTIWEYTRVKEKFISELGATALPNYESLIKFLPNHWPIKDHADEWVFHKLQIFEAMRAWGSPEGLTLQEYIPQTQDYVARLFQLAIERMRRLKYDPSGGILHFHAIDLWPSVTMAALDYYRQPTKAYHTVQRSFQMVLPSFAYDRDEWQAGQTIDTELWLINDRWEEIPQARVSWRVLAQDGKEVQKKADYTPITLPPDSSFKWQAVSFKLDAPGKYVLWATVADRSGKTISENNYEFRVK